MSTITVSNIKATGETASRAVSGVAAAWVQVDMEYGTGIRGSLNVSSFSDNATGDGHMNFSNSMNDTAYAHTGSVITTDANAAFDTIIAGGGKASSPYYRYYSTAALSFATYSVGSGYRDEEFCNSVHGDLA